MRTLKYVENSQMLNSLTFQFKVKAEKKDGAVTFNWECLKLYGRFKKKAVTHKGNTHTERYSRPKAIQKNTHIRFA